MSCSAAHAHALAPIPPADANRCASSSALGASELDAPLGASSSGRQNPGDSEKDAMPMSISGSYATQASAQEWRAGRGAEKRWVADLQGDEDRPGLVVAQVPLAVGEPKQRGEQEADAHVQADVAAVDAALAVVERGLDGAPRREDDAVADLVQLVCGGSDRQCSMITTLAVSARGVTRSTQPGRVGGGQNQALGPRARRGRGKGWGQGEHSQPQQYGQKLVASRMISSATALMACPTIMYGRRRPKRERVLSEMEPNSGWEIWTTIMRVTVVPR